jgi:hypothetical protein
MSPEDISEKFDESHNCKDLKLENFRHALKFRICYKNQTIALLYILYAEISQK